MANLETVFNNAKLTENGDSTYNSTLDPLLDILFMTEYYQNHLDEVKLGKSNIEKVFAMFIRDPRFGLGRRDLGRELMLQAGLSPDDIVLAGRYDDLLYKITDDRARFSYIAGYLFSKCWNGDELAKKWMPRYSSKNLLLAREFAQMFHMNKQQYGHFIKSDTVENKLSRKDTDAIDFEHLPSLAMLKYYKRFMRGKDTSERFSQYLEDVKSGKKNLNISTTTVYDIYRNRESIDADLFFDKIEKISGSWLPIIDTSGSMCNLNDSLGKALSIGHYLAKCSTYAPNKVVSFSSRPQLITLGSIEHEKQYSKRMSYYCQQHDEDWFNSIQSPYMREIESMKTGDCSNTDFGAVMALLKDIDDMPEYLIVLSDMEFDYGSRMSKDDTMTMFKSKGINTKIVWWNLNERTTTAPETDSYGNIFISGYNPMMLKYLQAGFDGKKFLKALLNEYSKNVLEKRQ